MAGVTPYTEALQALNWLRGKGLKCTMTTKLEPRKMVVIDHDAFTLNIETGAFQWIAKHPRHEARMNDLGDLMFFELWGFAL